MLLFTYMYQNTGMVSRHRSIHRATTVRSIMPHLSRLLLNTRLRIPGISTLPNNLPRRRTLLNHLQLSNLSNHPHHNTIFFRNPPAHSFRAQRLHHSNTRPSRNRPGIILLTNHRPLRQRHMPNRYQRRSTSHLTTIKLHNLHKTLSPKLPLSMFTFQSHRVRRPLNTQARIQLCSAIHRGGQWHR